MRFIGAESQPVEAVQSPLNTDVLDVLARQCCHLNFKAKKMLTDRTPLISGTNVTQSVPFTQEKL